MKNLTLPIEQLATCKTATKLESDCRVATAISVSNSPVVLAVFAGYYHPYWKWGLPAVISEKLVLTCFAVAPQL